ncbi:MAG: Uncharacterised protein [Formosa sp. Hel3_A1_48]|jgi:hypothetical protein|nr:MAG: Uncharacterised protein [Formosa sp. Hel3_A1_48]
MEFYWVLILLKCHDIAGEFTINSYDAVTMLSICRLDFAWMSLENTKYDITLLL